MGSDAHITRAVYPGTFDPVTNGHLSLIERASSIFDELIVAVSHSGGKSPLFSSEERLEFMTLALQEREELRNIRVISFEGLLADLVREVDARAIVRGLRAVSDFEYEFQMALMNRKLAHDVETVFLVPALSWVYLSSSLVKDVASNHGDTKELVPAVVFQALTEKFKDM
jgi:pantetheine-phosphate adenylyltransferase